MSIGVLAYEDNEEHLEYSSDRNYNEISRITKKGQMLQ